MFAALDGTFTQASTGFAGSESDGIVQLDASHRLATTYPDARDGNVVATARVALDDEGSAVLALGFGASQDEAVTAADGSLGPSFDKTLAAYKKGWKAYDAGLTRPRTEKLPGITGKDHRALEATYYLSANVLKASRGQDVPRRDRRLPRHRRGVRRSPRVIRR